MVKKTRWPIWMASSEQEATRLSAPALSYCWAPLASSPLFSPSSTPKLDVCRVQSVAWPVRTLPNPSTPSRQALALLLYRSPFWVCLHFPQGWMDLEFDGCNFTKCQGEGSLCGWILSRCFATKHQHATKRIKLPVHQCWECSFTDHATKFFGDLPANLELLHVSIIVGLNVQVVSS